MAILKILDQFIHANINTYRWVAMFGLKNQMNQFQYRAQAAYCKKKGQYIIKLEPCMTPRGDSLKNITVTGHGKHQGMTKFQ